MNPQERGITASLNRLGIRLTTGQWVGAVLAVLTGLIVARVLPFIYPLIFSRIEDVILGPGISDLRDNINTWMMQNCTCASSFVISFFSFLVFRRKRKGARR
jgi:hypothetical protein